MIESKDNIASCILCGTHEWVIVYKKNHNLSIKNIDIQFDQNIIVCNKCGCSRVVFNEDFQDNNLNNYYKLVERTPVNISKTHNKSIDPRVINSKKRIEFIQKNVSGKKFLEIGYGDGFTLSHASKSGFQCTGIDITNDYDYNSKFLQNEGIEIHNMNFYDFITNIKYDVISAFLLLEHIKDPNYFIDKIKEISHKDSIVVIEVPDIKNYKIFLSETQLTYEHVYHYTIETLELLFSLQGYKLVDYISPGAGYEFSLTAIFKLSNQQLPKFNLTNNGTKVLSYFNEYFSVMDNYHEEMMKSIQQMINVHEKITVFGAGNFFKTVIENTGENLLNSVDYFLDETISKSGKTFFGKYIYNLDYLEQHQPNVILIASELFANQIKDKLIKLSPNTLFYCLQNDIIKNLITNEKIK